MTGQAFEAVSIRRQPPAWRRRIHVPIHRMAQSSGFSLVELMIVAGLTAVVLAGLGALTLVSDVQVGRRTNSIQAAQEEWGRAVTFIQNEAANAASLSNVWSVGTTYPCNGGVKPTSGMLVLNNDAPASTIIYGVRSISEDQKSLYRGPQLLIRCGPFPPESTSSPIETVLLDRLPAGTPLIVTLLSNLAPVHDAELTITLKTGADSTYSGTPFRVHVQRSPRTP